MDLKSMELRDKIEYNTLQYLDSLAPDSDEFARSVSALKTLGDIRAKDSEWKNAEQKRLDDQGFKDEEAAKDFKFKIVDRIIEVGKVLSGAALTLGGVMLWAILDERGVMPRNAGSKLINRLLDGRR